MSNYAGLYGDLYRRFKLVIAATGQDPTADQDPAMTRALVESGNVDAVAHLAAPGDLAHLDQRVAELNALIRDLEADVEWVRRVRAAAGGQP